MLDLEDLPDLGPEYTDYGLSEEATGEYKDFRSLMGDVRYHNHQTQIPELSKTPQKHITLGATSKKERTLSPLFKDNFDLLGDDTSDMLFEIRENAKTLCGSLYSPPTQINASLQSGQKQKL